MNRTSGGPIPQHDHYARLTFSRIVGEEACMIGPFPTRAAAVAAARRAISFYPGDHASFRLSAVERPQ